MPKTILLVEDNEMNREGLYRLFTKRGYNVVVAEDGETAVQVVTNAFPDIILMDVSLPGLDGYEATKIIRSLERERGQAPIPIIALTAHAMVRDRQFAEAAGCTDFVSKPVNIKTLADRIRKILI